MVLDKCEEFDRACLAKWLLHKPVTGAAALVKALLRHALRVRAKVALLRKFRTQLKFLPELIVVKHFG
jgi:hypothetical protein